MKVRFEKLKSLAKNKKSRFGFLLSIAALITALTIAVSSTLAWIETISTIEIVNNSGKIAEYIYTNAEINKNSQNAIDLAKYFRASGNAHLSSASSANGKSFFFPQVASVTGNAPQFREGNVSDKNTNYIDFSFKVKAVGTGADFYFNGVPNFKIGEQSISDNTIRLAITTSSAIESAGTTRVYSYNGDDTEAVVGNTDGSQVAPTKIYAFKDFVKSETQENPLFSLERNAECFVNIKLWLQDPEKTASYAGEQVTADNFTIITGVKSTKITFKDCTSAHNSPSATSSTWNWVGNDNAKLWAYTASGKAYEMKKNGNVWTCSIGDDEFSDNDRSGELCFYRTSSSINSNPQNNYWNAWKTSLSQAGNTATPVYTAFGDKMPNSELGCGTWGETAEIKTLGDNAESILETPLSEGEAQALTLETSNNIKVPMNFNNGFWRAYVPNDETTRDLVLTFGNYKINAFGRDITQNASTYRVTSGSTGYWEPPAIVEAVIESKYKSMGSAEVSGGAQGATSVKVTKGTQVTLSAKPASSDYAFDGWYNENSQLVSNSESFEFAAAEKDKTYKFYARFQFNVKLAVKTDSTLGGTSGTVQINNDSPAVSVSKNVKLGETVTISTQLKDSDYQFAGWYNLENQEVYSANETKVTIESLKEPVNLVALYKVKTFVLKAYANTNGNNNDSTGGTVKFDSQASSGAYAEVELSYKDAAVFRANVKSTDGYEFKGWYSDEACTKLVTSAETYKADKNSENKTLYAKFELKKYAVNASAQTNGVDNNATGGTVEITADGKTTPAGAAASATVTHGNAVSFTAKVNSGYAFKGWYNSNDNSLVSAEETFEKIGASGEISLVAKFVRLYTVKAIADENGEVAYLVNNAEAQIGTTVTVENVSHGDKAVFKAKPKNGASFVGWFAEEGGTTPISTDETYEVTATGNVTVYARFDTSKRVYLKLQHDNWKDFNPWYAIYVFNSKADEYSSAKMTDIGDGKYFESKIPDGDWDKIIFCRMNPAGSEFNWDYRWNQTSNLDIPTDNNNCYYINGEKDFTGDWGTRP